MDALGQSRRIKVQSGMALSTMSSKLDCSNIKEGSLMEGKLGYRPSLPWKSIWHILGANKEGYQKKGVICEWQV